MIETVSAAALLGLAGSAHCIAMCGGIATALGHRAGGNEHVVAGQAWLALGRLATYGAIGALAGVAGLAIGEAVGHQAPQLARGARWTVGLLLVALGLGLAGWLPMGPVERMGMPLWRRLQPWIGRLGRDSRLPDPLRALALGGLWGLLPCGLVYAAAAVAAATGSAAEGALFMVGFGVGTLPAVVGVGTAGSGLWARFGRHRWRRVSGLAVATCGLWTLVAPIWMAAAPHAHHAH